ncbi:hypothetical protein BH10PSE5_BH10PSE5_02400 [soil metagenome]
MTGRRKPAARGGAWAGAAYVAIVFPVAFALGAVRTLLVAPRLGDTLAVTIEAPLILAVSWLASAWCVRVFQIPPAVTPRLGMGGAGFGLLMLLELGLSVLLFGRAPGDYLTAFLSRPGAIGLAAQLGFALVPLLQIKRAIPGGRKSGASGLSPRPPTTRRRPGH